MERDTTEGGGGEREMDGYAFLALALYLYGVRVTLANAAFASMEGRGRDTYIEHLRVGAGVGSH